MAITLDGTTGISTGDGNLSITGNVTTSGTLASSTGTTYPLVSGTTQNTTSGTSIDFTGIPNWVKRITVMYNGVSTSGTNAFLIQIGTSSGIETSGYSGTGGYYGGSNQAKGTAFTNGFAISPDTAGTVVASGIVIITTLGSNVWAMSGQLGRTDGYLFGGAGAKTLGGTLDRVRITTNGGTDTFDAGSINIMYE